MSTKPMPKVRFGRHKISRLVLGDNTINAGSHLSRFVNEDMRSYFKTSRPVLKLLADCEAEGISLWQTNLNRIPDYLKHRKAGGSMQFISLGSEDPKNPDALARLVKAGAIGIAHHGELTDRLFKEGKLADIKDYLAKVRDAGLQVGISTHMPDVIDYVESHGWDVDFYMACVYERHRTREQLKELLGYVPLPEKEVYLEEDPPRMFATMRNTPKTCLAFKILAAGRLCEKQELVEQAFKSAFSQIKPTDAVLVGIWPKYEDQVVLNAKYVRKFSKLSKQPTPTK